MCNLFSFLGWPSSTRFQQTKNFLPLIARSNTLEISFAALGPLDQRSLALAEREARFSLCERPLVIRFSLREREAGAPASRDQRWFASRSARETFGLSLHLWWFASRSAREKRARDSISSRFSLPKDSATRERKRKKREANRRGVLFFFFLSVNNGV